MNKKVMALAVAGALAAPAAAFAQASNVQIYGTLSMSMEQRSATGQDTNTAPAAGGSSLRAAPSATGGNAGVSNAYATAAFPIGTQASRYGSQAAGSNFGVRGREDLGSGMYAGFQIEMSVAPLGATPVGPTTGSSILDTYRNAGLWVGSSAFGELGVGQWDTPFTMVTNNTGPMHAAYGNASTSMSAGFLGGNPISASTISGQSIGQYCNAAGSYGGALVANCYAIGTSFNRRAANQGWYQSPNWGGFSFRGMAVAQTQDYVASNTFGTGGSAASVNELKPWMWGLSGQYVNGPLDVRVGYENHKDMLAAALRQFNGTTGTAIAVGGVTTSAAQYSTNLQAGGNGITNSNDTAWNINARYNMGAFSMGLYWERLRWNASYLGTQAAGAAGNVTQLSKTGWRLDGAWQGGPHTVGIQYGKNNNLNGSLDNSNAFDGSATGSTNWIFGYAYSLSKRTNLFAYHTRITNDTNARYSGIVFNGITTPSGADPRYTGAGIRHSF